MENININNVLIPRVSLLWDTNLSAEEFIAYLNGEKEDGWLNQDWAIARVIERVNYYDMLKIVSLDILFERWQFIKKKIWRKSISESLEYCFKYLKNRNIG